MITKVKRLSDLPILYNLITGGKTIVASGKSNYKIDLSLIKGRKIVGISQLGGENDHLNSIRIDYDTNESQYLYFYNGTVGDTGETGNKGPQGDKGQSFDQQEVLNRAQDILVIVNDDITNDSGKVWSAYRGKVLEDFLKSISSVIMTDEEYQLRFNEQVFVDLEFTTRSSNQNTYIIHNDNADHKTYVKYWTYEDEADERYYYFDETLNDYVEAPASFDIWNDYYLTESDKDYYTRHLKTTIVNEDTGESISEWVYEKISVPVWMDLEFETTKEDEKSILVYSDEELGDDGVVDKDPKEEEIVILHKPITSINVVNPNIKLPINTILTKAIDILPTDYLNSPIGIEYDENMIKVYEDGRIMALGKQGETSVKIFSEEDHSIFATININVVVPVIDIQFDTTTIKAFKNYTQQIHATVLPEDATDPRINWYSSDPEIAEVDDNGMITLKSEGKVTIYAETMDGTEIVSRIDVTVDTAVETISFKNTTKLIIGKVGSQLDKDTINELVGEEIMTDESIIKVTSNLTLNNRTKVITLATAGNAKITIDDKIVNVIVDANAEEFEVKESYGVLVGHSTKIEAEVGPENASNKTLNWALVNPNNIVSIGTESNGIDSRIYLNGKTNVDIVASPKDGSDVHSYLTIIGYNPVRTIELDTNNISLDLGENHQLVATVNEDADDKELIWSSDKPQVVSVTDDGFIQTVGGGDAVITVKAADGSGILAKCNVSSVILITGITINEGKDIDLYIGNEYMIPSVITPADAYNKSLIWYTSDETIATVNNGRVSAVGEGKVKIYAMADDNSGIMTSINANISIPTRELLLSDIELTLHVNESYSLIATVIPDNTTNQNVIFESTDPEIASIDNLGNITAISEGETEIFVSTIDGTNLSQKCTINIIN